jgi:hypothetical protein
MGSAFNHGFVGDAKHLCELARDDSSKSNLYVTE